MVLELQYKPSWWYKLFLIITALILLASANVCTAQKTSLDSIDRKSFLSGYPIAFFTPETRWGFGAAGVYNHYPGKNKSNRPSQWQVGGAYTLNKQILSFIFYNVFVDQDKHNFFGELAYYDYFFQYFGQGNNTLFHNEELYSAQFPRIQFNYLRKWKEKIYIGLFYHFDHFVISSIEKDGLLDQSKITGFDGSNISRPGLLFRYDSRDHIYYPSTGTYVNVDFAMNTRLLGASTNFQTIAFDISQYLSLKRNVIALNLWTGRQFGVIPFQEYLALGGGKKARGIIKGRYRDTHLLLTQMEYRFPIYRRFLGAIFSSYGNVGHSYQHLLSTSWKLNYGLGIRFVLDKTNKTNIRVDVAFGSDKPNYYFTINEAF